MHVLVLVTVRLDKKLLDKIEDIALYRGVTRSDIIREALEKYVEREWEKTISKPSPKIVKLEC